jgi:hypothetical protein
MNWKHALMLPLILALGSCAMEGGTRGSGISTAVQGNVAGIETAAFEQAAPGEPDIEGIQVAIEGTDAQDQTDADGRFALRGEFEGQLTLLFQLPQNDGSARLAINVPAGGTLTANNVYLDPQQGEATAEALAVDFQAVVTAANCDDRTLTLASLRHTSSDVDLYTLRLDTSSVHDTHGTLVPCEAFKGGEQLSIQGTVNTDGTFGHAVVEEQE